MMLLIGSFHVIQGFVAIFDDDYYLVGKDGLSLQVSDSVWGWVHVGAGILVMCAAFGLFAGQSWARVVGVTLAVVSVFLNFGYMAAYPFWSAIGIVLDVFVIVALTVHGRVLATSRSANALDLNTDVNHQSDNVEEVPVVGTSRDHHGVFRHSSDSCMRDRRQQERTQAAAHPQLIGPQVGGGFVVGHLARPLN